MYITPMGNINYQENYDYPIVRGFLLIIQLFRVIFLAIVPHIFVIFYLHVKSGLLIDKSVQVNLRNKKPTHK